MNRIRILFICGKLVCGGAEQALFDLVCLMDKSRFDITVFPLCEGGEWEEKFRNKCIRVATIWSTQKKSQNPWIKIKNWQKRNRIRCSLKNGGRGLIETCFDTPFDIIVLYKGGGNQRIAFSGNAKTVKYIHGDVETNRAYREEILKVCDEIAKFDKIICVSGKAKSAFENNTRITENVVAYFNPLNSENVNELADQSEGDIHLEKTICAVGRLAHEKGFERLIRIHKKIYDEGHKHRLILVGEGPMRELLENVIRSIHCEESVVLVGHTDNPYPYMKNSQFVVCSSYTEGLPVIAMEALSLGVPVVSSVPSIGELFGDENCGIITENDDLSLEKGIRKMLTDNAFYEQTRVAAKRRSVFFNGKRMVQEIEKEFIELMES